jgi:hypothetical protein
MSRQKMQDLREIVTATLGIAIVGFTLAMTGLAFSMAGEGPRMQDAITVLTLLFGLAGVVVGYYFGRVPAEARAMEAHERADTASTAMTLANQVRAGLIKQATEMHDEMQDIMDKAGLTPSMLQNENLDRLTSQQREQVKQIAMRAETGVSTMMKTLPLPSGSN